MTVEEFINRWKQENPQEIYDNKVSDGLLNGVFSVSKTKKVRFSRGNLQFNAVEGSHATADKNVLKGTWRFAEHQMDVIGNGNTNIAIDYQGWIDLFGWGTSGWYFGSFQKLDPWQKSQENSQYLVKNNFHNNLFGECANADWGVYNAISNGGNKPGLWRTLTSEEWFYLFCNNRWTFAKVNGNFCALIFPDNFVSPQGITIVNLVLDGVCAEFEETRYNTNVYTTEQFQKMENLGVVALPFGGYRNGNALSLCGEYWSASSCGYNAYMVCMTGTSMAPESYCERFYGMSVRLVQDVKPEKKKAKRVSSSKSESSKK